ncbi:clathrin interactor EPSIN 2-like [Papaver somniferum]|uniref:clathrin interactor EPSIN 2-like n=1 Tax=Papaver somniferum TaxID=3469 RepID=UPI000E6FF230|nr:clathrin interactor EPSIN 2-like [Papaver somniferum]
MILAKIGTMCTKFAHLLIRSTNSPGGMYRPISGGYGDGDRYGSRNDDRNGYGREREYCYKDDDRNSKGGDSYSRDGDHYGRDSDGGYKDDDYNRGRSPSNEDFQSGQKSMSYDRYREYGYDDDGLHLSRYLGSNRKTLFW